MSKIQSAVALAVEMANDPTHGYSQINRWGPDYDCSSFLIHVWQTAGVPVRDAGASYTGNMKAAFLACGFADVSTFVNLATGEGCMPGDILLNGQKVSFETPFDALAAGIGMVHQEFSLIPGFTATEKESGNAQMFSRSGDTAPAEECVTTVYQKLRFSVKIRVQVSAEICGHTENGGRRFLAGIDAGQHFRFLQW